MSVALYIEGGGPSPGTRALLRQGFAALLRAQVESARRRRFSFRLVCCGSRNETYHAFTKASAQDSCVLLVDSEDPLPPDSLAVEVATREFLARREQHWVLGQFAAKRFHLMVQCMESWLVADADALESYYGQGFRSSALPGRVNLEEEPKLDVTAALERATSATQKGPYHKIRHAHTLLGLINPTRVRQRCPHFGRLLDTLDEIVA